MRKRRCLPIRLPLKLRRALHLLCDLSLEDKSNSKTRTTACVGWGVAVAVVVVEGGGCWNTGQEFFWTILNKEQQNRTVFEEVACLKSRDDSTPGSRVDATIQ